MNALYTPSQVAELMHRDPATIRRWCREGDLRYFRKDGTGPMLIRDVDLEALIAEHLYEGDERVSPDDLAAVTASRFSPVTAATLEDGAA